MESEQSHIRYVKLTFTIEFQTSAPVPAFKESTLRGGLGDVLLNEYCIQDGNCTSCGFRPCCVVPGIYYHPLKIVPPSVKDGGSLGYTFECPDRRTYVRAGDRLLFSLLLYGDVIVYFTTILDAVYRLGVIGIGQKKQAKFQIVRVSDQDGNLLFDGQMVNPRAIHIRSLMQDAEGMAQHFLAQRPEYPQGPWSQRNQEYGAHAEGRDFRKNQKELEPSRPLQLCIVFQSPWTQKWKNEFLTEFQLQAFADAVYRRVYLLHCMEGIEFPDRREFDLSGTGVEVLASGGRTETRYSNHQEARIHLHGIMGTFLLTNVPEDLLPYIFAGSIVHIGKNTSIGFGKYDVQPLMFLNHPQSHRRGQIR